MTSAHIKILARECGFDLIGIASAAPVPEARHYAEWVREGMAGEMKYLADHRAGIRGDPRKLFPPVRSVICVGKLYNGPEPHSTELSRPDLGWIARYAWGEDYHSVVRRDLERLAGRAGLESGSYRICVDTAPLLEAAYARHAGLGWIGKNTCLINERMGSWFFLGELLTSHELEPDSPPPDRCGTCRRCIDACPTSAIVPTGGADGSRYTVDARRCISYFTIELRGAIPEEFRPEMGNHVFGCDICQDVCPWNGRAPVDRDPAFAPRQFAPPLERLAALSEAEFRDLFRGTPVARAKYAGFLRNVAVAMGNSGLARFREPLSRLSQSGDALLREHAVWALKRLG